MPAFKTIENNIYYRKILSSLIIFQEGISESYSSSYCIGKETRKRNRTALFGYSILASTMEIQVFNCWINVVLFSITTSMELFFKVEEITALSCPVIFLNIQAVVIGEGFHLKIALLHGRGCG